MDTIIGANNRRALQVKTTRKDGWTKARRKTFLNTLARTCNVSLSAKAAGSHPQAAYSLRRRDPAFASLWQAALACGYERLEEALLGHALQSINDIAISDDDGGENAGDEGDDLRARLQPGSRPTEADVRLALALLNRHRAIVEGTAEIGRGRRRIPTVSVAQTDAALRRKLDALARKLQAQVPQEQP